MERNGPRLDAPPLSPQREHIFRVADSHDIFRVAVGVEVRALVSGDCGALGLSTALATFQPGAFLPMHRHPAAEAITILDGEALLQVDARRYSMRPFDSVFIPTGIPHGLRNPRRGQNLLVHSAFASARVTRELILREYRIDERGWNSPSSKDPEKLLRFAKSPACELAPGTRFTDLFARHLGADGICGGYARFLPGASLPCHLHDFDESITIIKGTARCQVQGRQYDLSDHETAYIPEGAPHRFLNASGEEMTMIWVYAAPQPDRRILEPGYCSGTLVWPGPYLVR